MVTVDLDGTLLKDDKSISKETLDVIHEMTDKGFHFVVSTGRSLKNAREVVMNIDRDLPMVLYNGAMIAYLKSGKILLNETVDPKAAREVMDVMNERGESFIYWRNEKLYANTYDELVKRYQGSSKMEPIILPKGEELTDGLSKIIWLGKYDHLRKMEDECLSKVNGISYFISNPMLLEIVKNPVNKTYGIKKLSEMLGIKQEETIAIGDSENDFDMIDYAALGVAMGNATDECKSHANYITLTNNEDGVRDVIEKFVLNK